MSGLAYNLAHTRILYDYNLCDTLYCNIIRMKQSNIPPNMSISLHSFDLRGYRLYCSLWWDTIYISTMSSIVPTISMELLRTVMLYQSFHVVRAPILTRKPQSKRSRTSHNLWSTTDATTPILRTELSRQEPGFHAHFLSLP